jgi:phosphatidylserine/phosphatidylglycerophosphate/cardiolipin synthase-like enzyme
MSSYADLHRFFRERWDIARDSLAVYPDPQYKAEEAFYRFLTTAFASLADDEVPWDDLHIRWAIADVLLEAIVNLVPEAVEEVSE